MVLSGFLVAVLKNKGVVQPLVVLLIEFSYLWWMASAGQDVRSSRRLKRTESFSGVICCLLLVMELYLRWHLHLSDWAVFAIDKWIILLLGLWSGVAVLKLIPIEKLKRWWTHRRQTYRAQPQANSVEREVVNIIQEERRRING